MQSYENLKKLASQTNPLTNEQLERLKEQFAAEINTPRRKSCIRSIADLLAFLERCDVLSEQNITVLCAVADFTHSQALQTAILNYQPPKNELSVLAPHINQYAVHRLDSGTLKSQHVLVSAESYKEVRVTASRVASIHKMLCHEIGNCWRRLGRELGLSEAVMDEVEVLHARDLSSRIVKLLEIHRGKCDDLELHVQQLSQALVACQRRDLKRRMETML